MYKRQGDDSVDENLKTIVYEEVDAFMISVLTFNEKLEEYMPYLHDLIYKTYNHLRDIDDDFRLSQSYRIHRRKLHKMLDPYIEIYAKECYEYAEDGA